MLHFSSYLGPVNNFNPVVKIFIISEAFFWSAWSTVLPILSLFVVTQVVGATIQTATLGYGLYIFFRVLGSIFGAKMFCDSSEKKRIHVVILGILIVDLCYIGFSLFKTIPSILIIYSIIGIGIGLASPIRAAFFSRHLDKNKEALDWATLDSTILTLTALAVLLSGVIIKLYGFNTLFICAFILNSLSVIPYFVFLMYYSDLKTKRK